MSISYNASEKCKKLTEFIIEDEGDAKHAISSTKNNPTKQRKKSK